MIIRFKVYITKIDGKEELLENCESLRSAKNAKHYYDKLYEGVKIYDIQLSKDITKL